MADSLRLMCAEILVAVTAANPHAMVADDVRAQISADTLRYAERFEYGDPIPAAEQLAETAALEEEIGELEAEIEALRDLVAPTKLAKYDRKRPVAL